MEKQQTQIGVRDLAQQLSLSVGTISRVINGRPGVRPDVRQRVLKTIEQTGYVLNRPAQMMRQKRTHRIQWQIPTLRDQTYVEFMGDIDGIAAKYGYEIDVTSYQRSQRRQTMLGRDAIAQRMEAVIVMGGTGGVPTEQLLEAGVVVLAVNGRPPLPPGVASLSVDIAEGMRRLAHHLIQLGHRRFMVSDRFHQDPRRYPGLVTALREARLPEQVLVFETDPHLHGAEDDYNRLLRIFRSDPGAATAIMSDSDELAVGAISAALDAGLSVPGDVSVTGMGNLAAGRLQRPMLTTLSLTDLRMGEIAMEMLVSILEGDAPRDLRRTLSAEILIRQSTGSVREPPSEKDSSPGSSSGGVTYSRGRS